MVLWKLNGKTMKYEYKLAAIIDSCITEDHFKMAWRYVQLLDYSLPVGLERDERTAIKSHMIRCMEHKNLWPYGVLSYGAINEQHNN